jgi:glyoxylase-like metal-dependent hydrolase (beta-lactamase superfamily II)
LIEHPILEPVYLGMGAQPIAPLQNKWLMAKGTPVQHAIEPGRLAIAGLELEIIALPGHSLNQVGVALEGVCFAADGFFGPAILQKHGIPYAQDVGAQLASLDRLAGRGERWFLPGHGDLMARDELEELLATNQAAIERAGDLVRAALDAPGDLLAIARRVRQALALNLTAIPQYAIFVSAVSAHLGYLLAQGRAQVDLDEAGMVWRAVD